MSIINKILSNGSKKGICIIKKNSKDFKKKFFIFRFDIKKFFYFELFFNLKNTFLILLYIFEKKILFKQKKIKKIFYKTKLTSVLCLELYFEYSSKNLKESSYKYQKKIKLNGHFFQNNTKKLHSWFKNKNQNFNKIDKLIKDLKKKILTNLSIFKKCFYECDYIPNKITECSNFTTGSIYTSKKFHFRKILNKNSDMIYFDTFEIGKKYIQINGIKYLRLELIGKGGNSKVYKIISEKNKIFALKKAKIKHFEIEYLHNCINEISILKVLKNKHRIIQIQNADISLEKGMLFLVFEYGDCDLDYFIKKNKNIFSKIKILKIIWKQMLESVYMIHQERIVHGDLKPANFIFVQNSLKIIDFGISRPIQKNTTNITRNFHVGTLNYMSPEAVLYIPHMGYNKNKLKINRSSDIWSLGCILFQMVYSKTPFYHLPFMKKIQAIISSSIEISFLPVNLPNLNYVLKNCLRKKANLRPSIPELIFHPFLTNYDTINLNLINLLKHN